jgi:hypothetical protein
MANRISDAEIKQLKDEWAQRFDEVLRDPVLAPTALQEIADEARSLADDSDIAGQRRGLIRAAERLERAARERAAAGA